MLSGLLVHSCTAWSSRTSRPYHDALAEQTPDYEALWLRLGMTYTVHGAFMVIGGLLFAWSVLRAGWLPEAAIWMFAAGLMVNLTLALLPAPDILQTIGTRGTLARNAGLIFMGYAGLSSARTGGLVGQSKASKEPR